MRLLDLGSCAGIGTTAASLDQALQAMGVKRRVPWKYLAEAIPPAYTDFIGAQIAAQLGARP